MQLVAQQCCVASWDCLLRVLPPPRATNFRVAKSKSDVYFLQHENLLRKNVVIRAINKSQFATQHYCTTSCTTSCTIWLGLKGLITEYSRLVGPSDSYLAIEVATHSFLWPGKMIEICSSLFLRISYHICHDLRNKHALHSKHKHTQIATRIPYKKATDFLHHFLSISRPVTTCCSLEKNGYFFQMQTRWQQSHSNVTDFELSQTNLKSCNMLLAFESWMKSKSATIQMKAIEQYFLVVLFIMLYMVVLTFESNVWVSLCCTRWL